MIKETGFSIRNNPVFDPSSQYTENRLEKISRKPCYTATDDYAIESVLDLTVDKT